MNIPEWVKPGLYGAASGAIAVAIIGFSWGGWMTGGAAVKMANSEAQKEVVAVLAPICVEQSKLDPQAATTLAKLKDTATYKRRDMLMETGWATMPGSTTADRKVASACLDTLAANF